MIPYGRWACLSKPQIASRKHPLPTLRYGTVYDVGLGGEALGVSNGRIGSRYYLTYHVDGVVYITGAIDDSTWDTPIELFEEPDVIKHMSLSFDGLGRPAVFYQVDEALLLWFYDSSVGEVVRRVITTLGKTPTIDFDYIDDTSNPLADMTIYYVQNDRIYYRLQRDRFDIEYPTEISYPNLRIRKSGRTDNNRFQLVYEFDDMRDGSLLQAKVLETSSTIATNLQGKNLEVGFTIALSPSLCELRALKTSAGFGMNIWHTLVSHAGVVGVTTDSLNTEYLFSLEIQTLAGTSIDFPETSQDVVVVVRRTPFAGGEYFTKILPYSVFGLGTYVLKFITEGINKRIILLKNGTEVFNEVCPDGVSLSPYPTPTQRNRLRFGADVVTNNNMMTQYYNVFPAVYTSIYTIYDGVTTTWLKGYSDQTVPSAPTGNTLTLRRAKQDSTYTFWNQ